MFENTCYKLKWLALRSLIDEEKGHFFIGVDLGVFASTQMNDFSSLLAPNDLT